VRPKSLFGFKATSKAGCGTDRDRIPVSTTRGPTAPASSGTEPQQKEGTHREHGQDPAPGTLVAQRPGPSPRSPRLDRPHPASSPCRYSNDSACGKRRQGLDAGSFGPETGPGVGGAGCGTPKREIAAPAVAYRSVECHARVGQLPGPRRQARPVTRAGIGEEAPACSPLPSAQHALACGSTHFELLKRRMLLDIWATG
jgi:hypothetical protein